MNRRDINLNELLKFYNHLSTSMLMYAAYCPSENKIVGKWHLSQATAEKDAQTHWMATGHKAAVLTSFSDN